MKYFGTDGIRGKAYEKLTLDIAYKLGKALRLLNNNTVAIGMDTRESSNDLKNEVIKGALEVGLNVIDLDVLPSPALILESYFRKSIGVMITASHNPYYDNGLKVIKCGYKIEDREKNMIEDYLDGVLSFSHPINGILKKEETSYLDFLSKYVIRTKLNIVIDAANGAASKYVKIFDKMANVKYISNNPDGKNINNGCGATHLENLKNNIGDYDLGIAFDGDADRIMVIDKNRVYDGDLLIYIFAKYFSKKDMLKNDAVVLTEMSNLGVINALNSEGINTVTTSVGDQNVLLEMQKNGYVLGGENSGHIITPLTITGDGMLNAILLLTILSESNTTIDKLVENVEMYYDEMKNIVVNDKNVIKKDIIVNRVEEIRKEFGKYGKIVLRASGTEDLIRLSVMHRNKDVKDKYLCELESLIKKMD